MRIFRRSSDPMASDGAQGEGDTSIIQDQRWLHAVSLQNRMRSAEQDDDVSTRAWNTLVDQHTSAVAAVASDGALLDAVWELALDEESPEASDAGELLRTALGPQLDARSADSLPSSRVLRIDSGDLFVEPAVFLVETREAAYDSVDDDDDRRPPLSRVGGHPVCVEGRATPAGTFLLQLDFSSLRPGWSDDGVEMVLAQHAPLPPDGLLQVYGRPDGDSTTEPDLPGGGVTLVHLSESDLEHGKRLPPPPERPEIAPAVLEFTAHPTVRARFESDDEAIFDKARWLHDTINGSVLADSDDPSRNKVAPVASRLFGLQDIDHDLGEEDVEALHVNLPLGSTSDRHVLFLQISSLGALEEIFGDSGFLEIWLRESDLRTHDFSEVVSFLRSA